MLSMFHFYYQSITIAALSSMYCYSLSAFQCMLSNQGSSFIATRTLLLFAHICFTFTSVSCLHKFTEQKHLKIGFGKIIFLSNWGFHDD